MEWYELTAIGLLAFGIAWRLGGWRQCPQDQARI